jgi:hypothetical protein
VRTSVGEVAGEAAAATTALLRAWEEVPAMVELELREVSPGFVFVFERWVAAQAALVAAKQQRDADAQRLSLTKELAWSVAAVHEGMPR